jgi:hypothetical protein
MKAVRVAPITAGDVQMVGRFLQANLNGRIHADAWAAALTMPWAVEAPNHGFMLLQDDTIVGAYLAFYSERVIDDRVERFCNLAAWCVLPEARFHSLRLLNALLAQKGYHFTDLSPSGNTVPVNQRLKFQSLDTATAVCPNLPWPSWPGRMVVSSSREVIERHLTGRDLAIYRDHAASAAARHAIIVRGGETCYVVFRRDRRKGLPLFASILYVSNRSLFAAASRQFGRHLLLRHRVLATLAELRVVGERPPLSVMWPSPRPKMFRSAGLDADSIDYLYSELTCVAW